MIVYEFNHKITCNNANDLLTILKHRSKNDSNEFELRTEIDYPSLLILVKKEYACVHFFNNESDCGSYAYVDDNGISEEYITFNMGSENSETEISKDLIIPVDLAYVVALDFFNTEKMSNKINWFEL